MGERDLVRLRAEPIQYTAGSGPDSGPYGQFVNTLVHARVWSAAGESDVRATMPGSANGTGERDLARRHAEPIQYTASSSPPSPGFLRLIGPAKTLDDLARSHYISRTR